MNTKFVLCMIGLIIMVPCSGKKITTLKPTGLDQSKTITIKKGDLKAIFIDNTDTPPAHGACISI